MADAPKDRMQADLKQAMRSGDTTARDTIRFTLAAIKNAEIDRGQELTSQEQIDLLRREAKRRSESIEQFQQAGRTDLVERESAQLQVLERYLPAQLPDDAIAEIVASAIAETGASSMRDMGRVMPRVIELAAGRADGKRLSEAVRRALQ